MQHALTGRSARQSFFKVTLTTPGLMLALCWSIWNTVAIADIGDGSLHNKDWFATTFKDVAEDIEEASANGKRLALLFEQHGCAYCTRMHKEHLEDPYVKDYLQEHFQIVQYNLFGAEEVTDLDGELLTETKAAEKWGLMFTPTIVFMPTAEELETADNAATVATVAVAALPGLPGKRTFKHMFMWVVENGYLKDEHFQKYHARMLEAGL